MYQSTFVFYKLSADGITPTDVKAKMFDDPHSENRSVRKMRKNGYRTYRAPIDVWRIIIAAGAELL